MSIAVYTAILGGRDVYKEPPPGDYECTAFLEAEQPTVHARVVVSPLLFNDPRRTSRYYKILPQLFFRTDFAVWLDGSITFKTPIDMPRILSALADADVAVFRHRVRHCLYDEAEICRRNSLDHHYLIAKQVQEYRLQGYPEKNGLAETGVVLRRLTPQSNAFHLAWWDEVARFSRRDQISFNYVAWKTKTKVAYLEGTIGKNPYFTLGDHAA